MARWLKSLGDQAHGLQTIWPTEGTTETKGQSMWCLEPHVLPELKFAKLGFKLLNCVVLCSRPLV